jgi:hypothetical protein
MGQGDPVPTKELLFLLCVLVIGLFSGGGGDGNINLGRGICGLAYWGKGRF